MDFGWPEGVGLALSYPPLPFTPPAQPPAPQGTGSLWTLLLPAPGCHCSETMELWKQLRQAGLVPPGLGPPPQALRVVPPVKRVGQTLMFPGADTGGAGESLLWLWKELVNLRLVDVQLLGQLCSLGLEMGALQEELIIFLEEEEDIQLEGKQEGACGPAPDHRLPDFEMTI
ncbi:LOW QUALITY PROTEIN: glutamate-rich protein 4 [Mesoplodon densirostris]|uniref:LOW QUALITY PROTEIN: glutamate-rich protein 4 n=1 Tax=Mesoplodon densirostris TaxID=48708 RepID=UPI0028DB1759|nr:LOW QUALITY PROTEIN: glutamate-rich protein 4 [Mesoplodon densirostris]